MRVRVLRAFCIKAERQEPGSVVDLPDHVAREAIYLGKAQAAAAEPPPPGPTIEGVPEPVKGATRKGKRDV